MAKQAQPAIFAAFLLLAAAVYPVTAPAADLNEAAGIGVGITLGNIVFAPAKAASVGVGLAAGALSFIASGGNAELTAQIWRDATQGPYLITPDLAQKSVGKRPELEEKQPAPQAAPAP